MKNVSDDRSDGRHPGIQIAEAPVCSLLLQVVRAHAQLATEMLHEVGVVPPQEVVLLYLDDHGTCTQTELVRFMGRDRSTVTNTLQSMQRSGLIERRRSTTDARTMLVSLSERGGELVPGIRRIWERLEEETVGQLEAGLRDEFARALRLIRSNLWSILAGDKSTAE